MLADLAQAHGHPETRLPTKKKNSAYAPVILFVCWPWWPECLGDYVHMMEFGMTFMRGKKKGVDAHGW